VLKILVTGANGFIGKNLLVRLTELQGFSVITYVRGDDLTSLPKLVAQANAVIHLAGENRPLNESAFNKVNAQLTEVVCNAIRQASRTTRKKIPLILVSSTQAQFNNPYGRSKLAAEKAVEALATESENPVIVFRLPGVFGKWCKPDYNSVVATYCHNIARGLPIKINDSTFNLQLVYIDDVVTALIAAIQSAGSGEAQGLTKGRVLPEYVITLGALADQINAFKASRTSLTTERVGTGMVRALYATYVSYLPPNQFSYELAQHCDERGVFVEMLKTPDSGQFSYFTTRPGVTRGGHYHHTKTEKFLVIKGQALFRFRHIITQEIITLQTSGGQPEIVDTIPGWSHDITNVGVDEMLVMLWANENFDHQNPDTIASKV
jgi:UDP-2-acetamido-2,6-beta-L-arabino-hexul-4-ose reductase